MVVELEAPTLGGGPDATRAAARVRHDVRICGAPTPYSPVLVAERVEKGSGPWTIRVYPW